MTENTLYFTERSAHTAYFECDLDRAGYIIMNMPVGDWKEMGCPHQIIFSITPVNVSEQSEKVVA